MSGTRELQEYVEKYAVRGACCCGKCVDAPDDPKDRQPGGHTADMVFFKVAAADGADAKRLRELVKENAHGVFAEVDMFDGKEHGYMEVGAWIGDQGTGLMLMGLGTVLGLWNLLTPMTVMRMKADDPLAQQMAGAGFVTVQAAKQGAG